MAGDTGISLIAPQRLRPNPENPRLIFRVDELRVLQDSIKNQGILVPLTVYRERHGYVILDGERRWRCAVKLGLDQVPAIVQPKPDPLQNLMMMFAIHNQRQEWDPLPTAYKLQELEERVAADWERRPTEAELAELASVSRGEVRRLKALLALPQEYRDELMAELEKPREQQVLTVDHVLEATRGASALAKRGVIEPGEQEEELRRAVVDKFKSEVLKSTVEPRLLVRMARAVEREEISPAVARRAVERIVEDPEYSVEEAFKSSVQAVDFSHGTEQLAQRLSNRIDEQEAECFEPTDSLREALNDLARSIRRFLRA
ncbi:MAG TPA: ParB/RepB/Spo0J family partition protein [Solirubrobacterales bacterium]|nr:ParB/RepB/Spo0J family partition protein [Solirubrobacterales bacterium]